MAKPDLIKWVSGDEAAKITDPGSTKKLSGFLYKEKPPFQYLNWFFNQIFKWFRGLQGGYFDIIVGSATQVTNLEATHEIADLDDALVVAGTKVLFLDGTHTLTANFALVNNSIKIQSESVNAIIDVSTFTFTLSGNNVEAELKIINSGANDIIISGAGSFFKGIDLPITNVSIVTGSTAITTGSTGGIKNNLIESSGTNGNLNINSNGTGKVFINGKQQGFRGCLTGNTQVTLTTGVFKALGFTVESYDTDNIHDNASLPEVYTVPTGVTKIRIKCSINFSNSSTVGDRFIQLYKNGNTSPLDSVLTSMQISKGRQASIYYGVLFELDIVSPILNVVAGDYFHIEAMQNSGGDLDVSNTSNISMEIIE